MLSKVFEEKRNTFINRGYIEDIDEEHIVFFIMFFVDMYCMDILSNFKEKPRGRPPYSARKMLILILYSFTKKIFSPNDISSFTETDSVFKLIMENSTPSKDTIIRNINAFSCYYEILLSKSLTMAYEYGLTSFSTVCIDGTIIKAYNSSYNVMRKKDVKILIKILEEGKKDEKQFKQLRKRSLRFYYDDKLDKTEKLELLYLFKEALEKSRQKSIPLNDITARWMKNKKGKKQISYNLQTAVEESLHLITATLVSQKPTDHYLLPIVLNKAEKLMPVKPEKVLADAGYCTEYTISYLENTDYDAYIYNSYESRKDKGKLKINPSSKDNITIDYENNIIYCFAGQPLFNKNTYWKFNGRDKDYGFIKPPKLKRLFHNYEACKNCFYKEECLSEKETHKTYTVYGTEEMIKMMIKMSTPEAKEIYKKRSKTVESPFGILEQYYNINQIPLIGIEKIQAISNLEATIYNLKRIINVLHKKLVLENTQYQSYVKNTINQYKTPTIPLEQQNTTTTLTA